jgi:glucose dehydrogenase
MGALVVVLGTMSPALAVPALTVTPLAGPPTSSVTVGGTGYAANETVEIYFDTIKLQLASTNGSGAFSGIVIEVPSSAKPGNHWITAEGRRSGFSAQKPFTVRTNWTQFGRLPRHKHYNPFENTLFSSNVAGLEEAWRFSTGLGPSAYSSPAVAAGVVYVGSSDNKVYALDAATGAKKWEFLTGNDVSSSPAVANGVVYVGSNDNKVYALDAATGALKWSFLTGGAVFSSPAVAAGVVYVGSTDNKVYALDAATGAKKWEFLTGGVFYSSPAVANGVVYVGSVDNKVYALDASTGALKWSFLTGDDLFSTSPAVAAGVVYVGSSDNKVYALDASTGAKKWEFLTGNDVVSSPAVANGVVYVGSNDNNVYAFSLAPEPE